MNALLKAFPLAVVALAAGFAAEKTPVAAGGGGCRGEALTSASGDQVKMTGHSCFVPTLLYVEPGTEVTWTNETETVHDVAGAPSGWGSYEEIRTGETVAYTFEQPGTFPYYCFLHPGMSAVIVVGDGRAPATSVQAPAVSAPLSKPDIAAARTALDDRTAPLTASALAPAAGANDNPLLFAGLGALIGAIAVSLAVAAKNMRANS